MKIHKTSGQKRLEKAEADVRMLSAEVLKLSTALTSVYDQAKVYQDTPQPSFRSCVRGIMETSLKALLK